MPESLEKELKSRGRRLHLSGDRLNAYIYGTLRKTGWKPSGEGIHPPEDSSIDTGEAIAIEDPITREAKWALIKELGLSAEEEFQPARPRRRKIVATTPIEALRNLRWGY